MAFSSADIDAIDRAIVALGSGTQAVEVRFADGRTVKYGVTQLKELMDLRAFLAGHVQAAAFQRTTFTSFARD